MSDCRICGYNINDNIVKVLLFSEKSINKVLIIDNNQETSIKVKKLLNNYYCFSYKFNSNKLSVVLNSSLLLLEMSDAKYNHNAYFEYFDLIGIQYYTLAGIKNPSFIIQGSLAIGEYKIHVYADEKEIEYSDNVMVNENSFSIIAPFSRDIKYISLFVEIGDEQFRIISVKNKLISRLKNKIRMILNFNRVTTYIQTLKRGISFLWREHHFLVPPYLWKKYFKRAIYRLRNANDLFYYVENKADYNKWLSKHRYSIDIKTFDYNPLISIVIPVYNVKKEYLNDCIESILKQSYKNFEVCIVDDKSTNKETISALKLLEGKDDRIRIYYRSKNGHISRASNDGIKMAKGEYIALVDNDDTLDENALLFVVEALNNKKYDFIYSDEDKLDLDGKYTQPHFKPDFSPDTLMSMNYICHLSVIKKSIIDKVGGFEVGLEGAQDHDLFLKISEITNNIYHIPKVLYHWRISETSTAMKLDNKAYINDVGVTVVKNALKRRKLNADVYRDPISQYFIVNYNPYKENPLVSIIIPTKDYADVTETCLKSVYEKTEYKNYEVIIVNNNSVEEETFELFETYKKKYKNFRVIDANYEFNYSKINNMAVKKSKGEYIVLLNNDTEVISPNWLDVMLGYAMLPHIGAVGPKLLYPDTTVQHAGVVLGLGGVASHVYLGSSRDYTGLYGRLRVPYNYSCVTAACLIVKKSKYLEVGSLEETLKVAYNDVDFNIKLLKKGYYNICVPQVEMFHFESKSRGLDNTSEKYRRFMQESNYMFEKWGDDLLNDKFYNPNFSLKGWFVLDKENKDD